MADVNGVIEAKSGKSKFGTYGIMIDGSWYNSKYEIKANKGDSVSFDLYGKNGIKGLKVSASEVGPASSPSTSTGKRSFGTFPIPALDGQRSIIRQNAVTNANSLMRTQVESGLLPKKDQNVDYLLNVARKIEAYTTGDLDAEEAKRMVEEVFTPEDIVE